MAEVSVGKDNLATSHDAIGGTWLRWLWYDRSVRTQLLGTFVLINLVAGLAAAVIVIYNGRRAIEAELAASVEVAERFVRGTVERRTRENAGTPHLEDLAVHINNPRHVRILLVDADGHVIPSPSGEIDDGGTIAPATVPRWFVALVQVDDLRRDVPVISRGRRIGTIVVVGQAADEIIEIWQDASGLALLALLLNVTVFAILYVALGRVLHPLTRLATGLRALERGHYRHRLPQPPVRELADITGRFNALADSLAGAHADNARLNRQLVTVQDDERRQIAMELHDEMGPCLFGVKANVGSIGRIAQTLPEAAATPIRERVASLMTITERMQVANRDLLGRLRPMALGHVPLADAIAGLVADFEGADRDRRFVLEIGHLAHGYGNAVDLTVYRCLQEGVTNAVRHADAGVITIALSEEDAASAYPGERMMLLRLSVRDDGRGIAPGTQPGLGWSGMKDRVRALGGRLTLTGAPDGGTRLDIVIPLEPAEAADNGYSQP